MRSTNRLVTGGFVRIPSLEPPQPAASASRDLRKRPRRRPRLAMAAADQQPDQLYGTQHGEDEQDRQRQAVPPRTRPGSNHTDVIVNTPRVLGGSLLERGTDMGQLIAATQAARRGCRFTCIWARLVSAG